MISEGGTYLISGTLEDGQIVIDAGGENVYLVLSGVSVTNAAGPALWVKQAKNTIYRARSGQRQQLHRRRRG